MTFRAFRAGVALAGALVVVLGAGCSRAAGPVAESGPGPTEDTVTVEVFTPGQGSDEPTDQPEPDVPSDPRAVHTVVAQATGGDVVVRSAPDPAAEPVAALTNPTASGAPLVFRAVDGGATSTDWIEVFLPIRPNGSTGWVPRADVALSDNPFRIEIDRATYSLRVYELDELWLETTIAVGNGATPTPVGDFYLMELLAPPDPAGAYGPFAFGLSGFSEVLTEFGGADEAIIGLHGTNDPSSLGTDVSHGCVRLENSVIEELATTLPLGTPVAIT